MNPHDPDSRIQETPMSDFFAAELLTLPQAAKLVPPVRGGRTRNSTLARWIVDGCRMPDGSRLHLQAVRLGQKWCTSKTWLAEFFERLTAARMPGQPLPAPRAPAKRLAAIRRAEKRLEQIGA
jgi:hypothetical protein